MRAARCCRRPGRSAFRRRIAHKASKDFKDLPAGDGKMLVAEKCTPCHDVQRIIVKRSDEDDWNHTVSPHARPHGRRRTSPVVSDEDTKKIVGYLAANFKPVQPYDRQQPPADASC